MRRREALTKASGTSTAGNSVRHWWYQRLSAVILLPLSLWFIYELTTLASLDYAAVRSWITTPSTVILFILFIPTLFYHAQAGMQEVIEDYAATEWQRATALILMRFLAALCAFASILAILIIYLGV